MSNGFSKRYSNFDGTIKPKPSATSWKLRNKWKSKERRANSQRSRRGDRALEKVQAGATRPLSRWKRLESAIIRRILIPYKSKLIACMGMGCHSICLLALIVIKSRLAIVIINYPPRATSSCPGRSCMHRQALLSEQRWFLNQLLLHCSPLIQDHRSIPNPASYIILINCSNILRTTHQGKNLNHHKLKMLPYCTSQISWSKISSRDSTPLSPSARSRRFTSWPKISLISLLWRKMHAILLMYEMWV